MATISILFIFLKQNALLIRWVLLNTEIYIVQSTDYTWRVSSGCLLASSKTIFLSHFWFNISTQPSSGVIEFPYVISVPTDIMVISGVSIGFSFLNSLYNVSDLPVENTSKESSRYLASHRALNRSKERFSGSWWSTYKATFQIRQRSSNILYKAKPLLLTIVWSRSETIIRRADPFILSMIT